jgi:hypothetical protein
MADTIKDANRWMLVFAIGLTLPLGLLLFSPGWWLSVTVFGLAAATWSSVVLVGWTRLPRIEVGPTRLRHLGRRGRVSEVDRANVKEVTLHRRIRHGYLRVEAWDGEGFHAAMQMSYGQRRLRRVLRSRGWLEPGG